MSKSPNSPAAQVATEASALADALLERHGRDDVAGGLVAAGLALWAAGDPDRIAAADLVISYWASSQ